MFNLSKKEHLESLAGFLKKYEFKVKERTILSDSYVSLTLRKGEDFAELKLLRKWKRIYGEYEIKIISSNIELVLDIDRINQLEKKRTKTLNFTKKKFHNKLNFAISAYKLEHKSIYSSNENIETLKKKVERIRFNPIYEDQITKFDFIKPAIGIETKGNTIYPVFGISVGTDSGGGIILFNPLEGQLEIGTFVNLGDISIYDTIDLDLFDFSD